MGCDHGYVNPDEDCPSCPAEREQEVVDSLGHGPVTLEPLPNLYGQAGSTFLQHKGSALCIDIYCLCGLASHWDLDFMYAFKCPHCKKVYRLGTQLAVYEDPEYTGVVQEHTTKGWEER